MGHAMDRSDYIKALVDEAPPLTPAVRDRLAELLRHTDEADEAKPAPPNDAA